MKEARDCGAVRLHLGHPPQLKIILSSLSKKATVANAKCKRYCPREKYIFSEWKHNRHDFQEQQNEKPARQSHFISASFDTPFRGELIFCAFIYPLANKIVKKSGELLRGYSDSIKCALVKLKWKLIRSKRRHRILLQFQVSFTLTEF